MMESPRTTSGLPLLQLNCQLKNGASYRTHRPTRLDEIKNFHTAVQAGGIEFQQWHTS